MKQEELKSIVATGDIIISRTDFCWYKPISYLSWAIRMFAKTDYNHASVVVIDKEGFWELEAIGRGVVKNILGERLAGKRFIILRPNFLFNKYSFANRAKSIVGIVKYDVIGLIFQAIYLTLGIWVGPRKEDASDRMYCFEYAFWCHKIKGHHKVMPKQVIKHESFHKVLASKLV